jgi:lipoyl(octanoyl) transferase
MNDMMQAEQPSSSLCIKTFATPQDYAATFAAMKSLTEQRDDNTPDKLWLLQHPSVLTQGQAGKPEHILINTDIPIVQTDRGGQVTWHGEGQLVGYFLFDLNRLKWHVRDLVNFTENMMLWILKHYHIEAYTKADAPGVYVEGRKIGSLGFKIRRGRSYHGLSLNIDCSLDGFQTINPCGYAGLEMVRLCDLITPCPTFSEITALCQQFIVEQQIFSQIDVQAH